ncbi:MAG: hypothetical protein AAB472_03845 [Patescibacteria group bacterium]
MPEQDEVSSLERVRERLYSNEAPSEFTVPQVRGQGVQKPTGWEKTKKVVLERPQHHISGPARFFIVALAFFIITAGGATLYLVYGGRSVSTNNVIMGVQGPTTTASGDIVPLLISIDNKNPVAMRDVQVSITFPQGTKAPEDSGVPLLTYTENLGDIGPGEHIERTVKAAVFGSEQQQVTLPVHLVYHTDESNSAFIKDKSYQFVITTSPISLSVSSSLVQISSGQPVTVDVTVRSNATTPLENVAVTGLYPFGFAPSTTSPKAVQGTLFVLGTLAPGEERHIRVVGTVSGDNNDDRVFSFTAGTLAGEGDTRLATSYTTKEVGIKLTKPFLATTLAINHDASDSPILIPGSLAQGILTWTNTLATPITTGQITIQLSGNALDSSSVTTSGFYRSSDTTIIFTGETSPGLARLEPGDTGQGNFSFLAKKSPEIAVLRNPAITVRLSVSGQRIGESKVPETVQTTITKTIKIGTDLALSSRVLRTIGPIANTGPYPPVANKETTFTIQYALTNTVNSVAGAKVSATLPSYVRYTGVASPNDGSVTYNEASRTVTWSAGEIPPGTTAPKTVSFQVALLPSSIQQGTSPILISAQQVTGTDRFTSNTISGSVRELNTQATTDPAYTLGQGNVQ